MANPYLTEAGNPRKPGFLERFGIRYYQRLLRRRAAVGEPPLSDEDAERRLTYLAWQFGIWSFVVGGISAFGSALPSMYYFDKNVSWLENYGVSFGVMLALSAVEFYILFILSLKLVYQYAMLAGHDLKQTDPVYMPDTFVNLLARAALEVPDPILKYLDLDPMARAPRRWLFVVGVLYKIKIGATSVLTRLVIVRILGKSILSKYSYLVSVPVTGFWNAWTLFKVARDARLRIYGSRVADNVADQLVAMHSKEPLSPQLQVAALEAVGNVIVFTQNYHPNMMLLIVKTRNVLNVSHGRLDDWQRFLTDLEKFQGQDRFLLLNLVSIAAAFDGRLSSLERTTLPQAFGSYTATYLSRIRQLRDSLADGRLHRALQLAQLSYRPDVV